MSKDIDREKKSQPVCSKYFASNSGMDESLTDFQEPKKLAGPKTAPKKKPDKPKKAPKKIRGQRDIRKVIKAKKSELESFSKDFDHVCKQAGLDVDSDQLQLAIALSKSLQQPTTSSETSETSQPLSAQDRVGKIRTTLLEYGFKVPEIKTTTSKRLKKRKKYKLLLTSDEAKNQIISDNYTQVLFQNITPKKSCNIYDNDTQKLYYLTSNATYSILKSTDTFYVTDLLEKSTSTGNLLRDWSEIRGRPVSPKHCDPDIMNFSEIECSQDQLDIVLSGSLKSCKNIIKSQVKQHKVTYLTETKELVSANNLDNTIILIDDEKATESTKSKETLPSKNNEIVNQGPVEMVAYRSISPDMFDDESINEEKETHTTPKTVTSNYDINSIESDQKTTKDLKQNFSQDSNITKRGNDFMEITECVEIQSYTNTAIKNMTLKLSQDVTKRKSNDFMEITNCIVNPELLPIESNIDLTTSPENIKELTTPKGAKTIKDKLIETFNQKLEEETKENVILKNNSKNNEELFEKTVAIINNNIDLTESPDLELNHLENKADKSIESLDLTQSSNISDELPFVSLKSSNKAQSTDDTIILDPKEYEGIGKPLVTYGNEKFLDLTQSIITHNNFNDVDSRQVHNCETDVNIQKSDDILDLTQEIAITSVDNNKPINITDTNLSFFEDYVHNHSDNHDEITPSENNSKDVISTDIICADVGDMSTDSNPIEKPFIALTSSYTTSTAKHTEIKDIDLTQSSESSEDFSQNSQNNYSESKDPESDHDRSAGIEIEVEKVSQSDIDLTQNSESEENSIEDLQNSYSSQYQCNAEAADEDSGIPIAIVKSFQRCSSLGKKDDVSIDYDELYDCLIKHSHSQISRTSSKSAADNTTEDVFSKSKDASNCSQNSEVFVISDNELDYSMHQSKLDKPVDNFLFGGISIMDELPSIPSFKKSINIENNSATANVFLTSDLETYINQVERVRTPVKHKRISALVTPQKPSCSGINSLVTPSNTHYDVETVEVTPMPKYEYMSTDELHVELDKFGVKPFKRKRAIQLLTHIYNQTHPAVEPCSDEESPCKKRKTSNNVSPKPSPRKLTPRKIVSPKKTSISPRKVSAKKRKEVDINIEESNRLKDAEVKQISRNYEVDETPVIKEIVCSPDDWVFQKREKAKVHSCRVPLHIAFQNYVYSRRGLREAILCYEPINIDDVHKDLVAYGHRYDPKDLLKFMDKKCITVKTTDNDGRNHKR